MVDEYVAGENIDVLALRYGVHEQTVSRHVRKAGHQTRDVTKRLAHVDFSDAPRDLFRCVASYFEIPHVGSLHAVATPARMEDTPFDLNLSYEGLDGPLVLTFDDGTILTAEVGPEPPAISRWDAGLATGLAQQRIESVVSLARLAELPESLMGDDRRVAEALLALLGSLARTSQPPKGVVRSADHWLGRKADLFVDEAVKVAGKTAGAVAVGGTALLTQEHLPALAEQLHDLIDLAS